MQYNLLLSDELSVVLFSSNMFYSYERDLKPKYDVMKLNPINLSCFLCLCAEHTRCKMWFQRKSYAYTPAALPKIITEYGFHLRWLHSTLYSCNCLYGIAASDFGFLCTFYCLDWNFNCHIRSNHRPLLSYLLCCGILLKLSVIINIEL